MKICVTSTGKDLNANVDPRFGRCKYFIIIDTDSMSVESISNESAMASGGAGIQAAQTVVKTGAKVLITGNVGPNAFQTLSAAGVKIVTGATGTVNEVVEKYKKDGFSETKDPSVNSHFGMGGAGKGLGVGGR